MGCAAGSLANGKRGAERSVQGLKSLNRQRFAQAPYAIHTLCAKRCGKDRVVVLTQTWRNPNLA
eukprot:362911-Chlamydomonas_euryale.AAC.2